MIWSTVISRTTGRASWRITRSITVCGSREALFAVTTWPATATKNKHPSNERCQNPSWEAKKIVLALKKRIEKNPFWWESRESWKSRESQSLPRTSKYVVEKWFTQHFCGINGNGNSSRGGPVRLKHEKPQLQVPRMRIVQSTQCPCQLWVPGKPLLRRGVPAKPFGGAQRELHVLAVQGHCEEV